MVRLEGVYIVCKSLDTLSPLLSPKYSLLFLGLLFCLPHDLRRISLSLPLSLFLSISFSLFIWIFFSIYLCLYFYLSNTLTPSLPISLCLFVFSDLSVYLSTQVYLSLSLSLSIGFLIYKYHTYVVTS